MNQQLWAFILIIMLAHKTISHFGYSRQKQHFWIKDYKTCAGKWQSPIAISSSKSVSMLLPALEKVGYHNFLPDPVFIQNNGHSVTINNAKNVTAKRLPYIFGALLNPEEIYIFEGLHFHWGHKNNRGSEHVLNGIRFPMEMHIIHRNTKYSDFARALNHKDGLSVLAIFFQLQEKDNEKLNPILKALADIQWLDMRLKINMSLNLASLMPHDLETFYTYKGSLTKPPCSEVVTWIIFSTPVPISFKQISKFRTLSNGEDILADNYRSLQDIGNRKIYVRRLHSFANKVKPPNFNISNLLWYWQ